MTKESPIFYLACIFTLYNVCVQYSGGDQYRGGYHEYRGGCLEYRGGVQYRGRITW